MPNWCSNRLSVTGEPADLEKFAEAVHTDKTELSLNKLVPIPQAVLDDGDAWYDWCCANWGTKWDVYADVTPHEGGLRYTFDSAWSPPEEAIAAAAKQHPKLNFVLNYWEEGADFGGQRVYAKGVPVAGLEETATETVIRLFGYATYYCDTCDGEYTSSTPNRHGIACPSCRRNYCVHCEGHRNDHASEGKCLYAPTRFEPMSTDEED